MPTHKKGQDRDKYYHLAKDQGYRSRAAFKLIQINRRYDILSKARVCIDLCAAPGGWCQVAAKFMPAGSIIVGVDLLPIRAIRNVKTIVADITTTECKRLLVDELQNWQADVVLCDGAPNIGASYSKDAFVQNELVLAALKTATSYLKAGGSFCTKVYRSVDYNAILWVLQQLFEEVQAVKPSSSRSQSSEIFLVCLKYTAPKYIDPKMLDPNHVFKDVGNSAESKVVDVLHKKHDQHNKRHRSGYADSVGVLLQKKCSVLDYLKSNDPVRTLTDFDTFEITDDCKEALKSIEIPIEIMEFMSDIKLLSKSDIKKLLKWRQSVKAATMIGENNDDNEDLSLPLKRSADGEVVTDRDPAQVIDDDIDRIRHQMSAKEKRELKKQRKRKSVDRQRQALGINNNAFEEAKDLDMFDLTAVNALKKATGIEFTDIDSIDDQEDEVEDGRSDSVSDDDMSATSSEASIDDTDDEDPNYNYNEDTPAKRISLSKDDGASESWFSHPLFKESLVSDSSGRDDKTMNEDAYEDMMPKTDKEIRKAKRKRETEKREQKKAKRAIPLDDDDGNDNDMLILPDVDLSNSDEMKTNVDYKERIALGMGKKQSSSDSDTFEVVSGNFERKDDRVFYDPSQPGDLHEKISDIALGTLMMTKSKRKAIVDASYNRYSWNDPEDLPDWFVEDETKHNKPEIPIPKGLLDNVKARFVDTGTKDIKKVAEARMRKRKRALNKIKAAKKKAMTLVDNNEMSGRQKVKAVAQAIRAAKTEKQGRTFVFANKTKGASNATVIGKGKGKLKFVDKRMKKDLKMQKSKKRGKK